ncbi:MAG TPA: hypothetical protein VHW74_03485 [Mycobacteriales bacterium]|nr:hypothetical protein [Mycobacteriales bacterium]
MRRGIATIALIATTIVSPESAGAASRGAGRDGTVGLVASPDAQSAAKGSVVALTVQVAGAAAGEQVSYVVVGRNDGVHGSVTTGNDGTATLSYRDHGTSSSRMSDTIALIDAAQDESATATVDYLDGPAYAAAVTLDASGFGVGDASCGDRSPPIVEIPIARDTAVCARISNAIGEPLAGRVVTFAVSVGAVGPAGDGDPEVGATYQALTDRAGIAFALVTSTAPGVQQILTTVDYLSGEATLTYAPPTPQDAARTLLTPERAAVHAGMRLRLATLVVDAYGNPVAAVPLRVELTGVGALDLPASGTVTTGPDGRAPLAVATAVSDRGPGSVTATIATSLALCGMTGSCSATASYTVTKPIHAVSLTLEADPGARVGATELVAAIVKGSDGSVVPGQLVHFRVSGADIAAGTVRTNRKGVALFGYPAQRRGVDLVRAWDDVSRDGRRESREPGGLMRLVVAEK